MAVLARNVGIKGDFSLYEAPMAERDIPPLEFFRDQAFAARADLKSLETQKKIAADQIRYAEGAYWPTVSLSGVYAGTDQYPATGNLVRDSFYAGIGLNFPFFEGGLRKADVSEAKARERQAALQYEDLKKGIDIEVKSTYLDLVTQKGILKFLNDQLVYARDNYPCRGQTVRIRSVDQPRRYGCQYPPGVVGAEGGVGGLQLPVRPPGDEESHGNTIAAMSDEAAFEISAE